MPSKWWKRDIKVIEYRVEGVENEKKEDEVRTREEVEIRLKRGRKARREGGQRGRGEERCTKEELESQEPTTHRHVPSAWARQ